MFWYLQAIITPSANIVTEPEFNLVIPDGVSCHYHRYKFGANIRHANGLNDVFRAADDLVDASRLMADVQPSVIAMTGTGTSFIGGYEYDLKLIEKCPEMPGHQESIRRHALPGRSGQGGDAIY